MYDLRVLVNHGPIKKFRDDHGKAWVEAREGTEFTLKVQNSNWKRILAVVSVDGLNVINGKREDVQTARGYVISGNGSITIPGWRISREQVKQFIFTPKGVSYAEKVGADPDNIGVIAVAIFEEVQPKMTYWPPYREEHHHHHHHCYPWWDDWSYPHYSVKYGGGTSGPITLYSCSLDAGGADAGGGTSMASSPDAGSVGALSSDDLKALTSDTPVEMGWMDTPKDDEKLGVGSGDYKEHKTHSTSFKRGNLAATLVIYYDTLKGLKDRGIYVEGYKESKKLPRPFPNGNSNYCPDV